MQRFALIKSNCQFKYSDSIYDYEYIYYEFDLYFNEILIEPKLAYSLTENLNVILRKCIVERPENFKDDHYLNCSVNAYFQAYDNNIWPEED